MDKPFRFDAQVNEAAEVCDVRHDARHNHAFRKVGQAAQRCVEAEHLATAARVAPGFVEFLHDVGERGHTYCVGAIFVQVNLLSFLRACYEVCHTACCVLRHALYECVAFGVHGSIVERIVSTRYAQESGALLVGLSAQSGDALQFLARAESTVRGAIIHNVLRQSRSESRNVGEQVLTCGVEVYAHGVYATLNGEVERLFEGGLVHVVLVLSDANGLRVNLDQFRQRVGKAAPDADGATHRDVVVGKFVARNFRSRIYGRPIFTHEENGEVGQVERAHQLFGFAACCAIADGYGFNMVLLDERREFSARARPFVAGLMGEDGVVVQQVALRIEAHHLASRSETRVNAHDALLA